MAEGKLLKSLRLQAQKLGISGADWMSKSELQRAIAAKRR